jgi:hypothetical protein
MSTLPAATYPLQARFPERVRDYLERISRIERQGDAREESFYPELVRLLEGYAEHRGRKDLAVLILPRKTDDCLLDLQVRRGEAIVGYVEAKRPGTDLSPIAETDQLKRYRAAFPNLLLTNFRELRLYRGNELAARADAGHADLGPLLTLLDLFCDFSPPPTTSAAELAQRMALRTRLLAVRLRELLEGDAEETSELAGFYKAFSRHLVAGLAPGEFADLYAQTLAYGLLAARWRARGPFDRRIAAESIPATSGLLRDAFRYISLADPPREVAWIVDEIVDLLAHSSVHAMLERSVRRGCDPVLDFYETFLHSYDAGLRKRRGVYYTPPELVSWVVRSVHRLLQTRLGWRDGLADPRVSLLDPAAGTLTFVVEAIRRAVDEVRSTAGGGVVPALIGDHLLTGFHAFELMMAPYAVGHLKMSLVLEELGRPLREGERVAFYLTNTLEMEDLEQSPVPGTAALARESHLAGRIKKETRVNVVLGNPPWSGRSANQGKAAGDPVREGYAAADGRRDEGYYQVDGEPLGEKNPKWLQDDYVKFLRFAQRKVDQAGEGIVAFVTGHGYLDNPTFRGMRRSLLATFDEIHLLDLHGNGKKKERAPDGSEDANVFADVRQGAAVAILVKKPGLPKRVLRADLWGSRAAKLAWLEENDVETTPWTEIAPEGPAFLFAPRDAALEREYRRGLSLPEIFPVHSVGIVTGRNAFALDTDQEELERRVGRLRSELVADDTVRRDGWGSRDQGRCTLEDARRKVRADPGWRARFRRILFQPFDWRTIFYDRLVVERPREEVMRHLLMPESLGLVVPRQHKEEPGALVADTLVAHKAVSAFDINTVFPLYLDPEGRLYGSGRIANLAPASLRLLGERLGEEPSPELVLQYVYAVLYSPPYRRRYAGLLRADFPRVPLPPDRNVFLEFAGLGAVLIDLHLLRSDRLDHPEARFEPGSGKLKGRPEFRDGRVIVNPEGKAIAGIPREVWEYRVGGYQVLDRWLAGRSGRVLRLEETKEFQKIAEALRWTIEYQRRVGLLWGVAFQGSCGQECLG